MLGDRALVVGWLAGALLVLSSAALAGPKDDFKRGLEAADLGRFGEAVEHLRRAVDADPRESTDQVFLSGVFSRPYLPHFYLGDALFRWDPDAHCEEALRAWDESLRQGVVRELRGRLRDLEEGREACAKRVWPELERRRSSSLAAARAGLDALDEPLGDPALEERRRRLAFRLEAAGGSRPSELDDLRAAVEEASELEGLADDLAVEASSRAEARAVARSEALDAARSAARRAIVDAEGARSALGDVEALDAEARRRIEPHLRLLDDARARLDGARDAIALEELRGSVTEAAAAFDALRVEQAAARRRPPGVVRSPSPGPSRAKPPSSEAPRRDPAPSLTPSAPEPADLLEPWVERGNRLLAQVGEAPPGRRLHALHHARLSALLAVAGQTAGDEAVRTWIRRFRESALALRLVVGLDAFFAAEHRRAVAVLSEEVDSAGENASNGIRAHLFLVRAAAQLSLFRLGGEVEEEMRRRAVADLRRAVDANPGIAPATEDFSPAFRALFEEVAASRP